MFDLPSDFYTVMDFFSFAIAVVAFLFARKAFNQASTLRARLDAIEAAGLQARAVPPPLTPLQELEQTLAAPPPAIAVEEPPSLADAPSAPPAAETAAPPEAA